ncbi:MAG TPA: MFS transporter, partial [Chloroflexota bacterium]|nr:MFS transporter [Chloroflexota bacterium]
MSKRGAALAVLVGIQFLNYFDRNVTPAVAAQVQHDFGLSDAQLGLAGSIFILAFALAVLPLGRWADRGARRTVIGIVVGVWGVATFASGLARSYWQLLAARAVLGIGEAGYYPAASSMLADHFGKEQRGRAFGPINSGVALGAAAGMIVSGVIATRVGWRPAFFVAGLPALVLAFLAFRLPEPRRG